MSKSTNGRRDAANGKGASSSTDAPFVFDRAAAKWKGYVNIEQTEASKKQYANYAADPDLVAEVVATLPVRGYKLSVVCDVRQRSTRRPLTRRTVGCPTKG